MIMHDFSLNSRIGVVVIGRNEGERLISCLHSLIGKAKTIVYVDSGSIDDSVSHANKLGMQVVMLDLNVPFTAARARNEGFQQLIKSSPEIDYVQFVDGDCEVAPNWIAHASNFLVDNTQYAVVCGRRRERYPEKSIFNFMCDSEWDTPIGDAKACGGDALMRVKAFQKVGGFRIQLIAGEEPELCLRLRASGYSIRRLDYEMTLHDAAMTKFNQWWKRTTRAGYAFAEGVYLHGTAPEKHWVKESRRALVWGLAIPIVMLLIGMFCWQLSMIIAMVYPLQIIRLALKNKNESKQHTWKTAFYNVLGKFAEMYGQLRFYYQRLLSKPSALIEYK